MSKEIKMGDMFDLPLVGSESPFVRDSSGNCVIYAQSKLNDISELKRISRAKHAVHAINNHDRLVEENKRLRDMLKQLTSHDNCKKDVIHLMSEADSLLEELGGE